MVETNLCDVERRFQAQVRAALQSRERPWLPSGQGGGLVSLCTYASV